MSAILPIIVCRIHIYVVYYKKLSDLCMIYNNTYIYYVENGSISSPSHGDAHSLVRKFKNPHETLYSESANREELSCSTLKEIRILGRIFRCNIFSVWWKEPEVPCSLPGTRCGYQCALPLARAPPGHAWLSHLLPCLATASSPAREAPWVTRAAPDADRSKPLS